MSSSEGIKRYELCIVSLGRPFCNGLSNSLGTFKNKGLCLILFSLSSPCDQLFTKGEKLICVLIFFLAPLRSLRELLFLFNLNKS